LPWSSRTRILMHNPSFDGLHNFFKIQPPRRQTFLIRIAGDESYDENRIRISNRVNIFCGPPPEELSLRSQQTPLGAPIGNGMNQPAIHRNRLGGDPPSRRAQQETNRPQEVRGSQAPWNRLPVNDPAI